MQNYWPYKQRPDNWMQSFIRDFDRSLFNSIPLSDPSINFSVLPLDMDIQEKISKKFIKSCLHSSSPVKSLHVAESSLVLFDKKRQLRATKVLSILTTSVFQEVYRNVYGNNNPRKINLLIFLI
jgi:hypothetical protein